MTTPLDRYVAVGHSPDWSYRSAGRMGTAVEIAIVAVAAGLLAVISGALFGASLAAALMPSAGLGHGVLADAAAGFALGGLAWSVLSLTGFRRLTLGMAMVIATWVGWTILTMILVVVANLVRGMDVNAAREALSGLLESPTPEGVMFRLFTFAGIWPGLWAALRLLHRQSFGTVFSPLGRIHWREFGGGLMIAALFGLLTLAINSALVGLPARTGLPLQSWAVAVVPLVVLLFFQASGEEIVFRGYLLQQLGARFRSPLVWGFLPAFLFGMAHYANGAELGMGWHYVAVTALVGMAAAALVWRTGSLAMAMGLHTGLNIFSLLGVGLAGIIEGTQLYLYDGGSAETLFLTDGVGSLLILAFVLSPLFPARGRAVAA